MSDNFQCRTGILPVSIFTLIAQKKLETGKMPVLRFPACALPFYPEIYFSNRYRMSLKNYFSKK